jgi:hypothetical protein
MLNTTLIHLYRQEGKLKGLTVCLRIMIPLLQLPRPRFRARWCPVWYMQLRWGSVDLGDQIQQDKDGDGGEQPYSLRQRHGTCTSRKDPRPRFLLHSFTSGR